MAVKMGASLFARVLIAALIAFAACPVGVGQLAAQEPFYRVINVTAGDILNVRSTPSARSTIVGKLAPDTMGIRLAGPSRRNGRSVWQKIRYGDVTGWVNAKFIAVAKQPDTAPKLATSENVSATLKKRIALVVGNGDYRHGLSKLTNAPNDGRDVAAALKKVGFDVVQITNADLESSKAALAKFAERAKGAEIALFFFAGHGIQVNGENYLLPTSANLKQPEDLLVEAMSMSDIMKAFREAAPALSIVVLDACRNNPVTGDLQEDARSRGLHGIKIGKGLAKRSGLPGMMIVYSTDPDNVASDGTGRNSPFSSAFLKNMQEPEVEVRLMFGAVRDTVVKATKGRQTPWMEEAVLGRYFFRPPPRIRTALFHGRWQAEHWTLLVDADRVELRKPPFTGVKPQVLSKATCGSVFKRTYTTAKVNLIRQELGNPRIEEWARRLKNTKTVRVMKVVCAYGANLYYFLLGDGTNLLAARFSEQDWLMLEQFDKDLR